MEEDDAADAGVDPIVGGEEELAVESAVLLRVLRADAAEALGHTACRSAQKSRGEEEREKEMHFRYQIVAAGGLRARNEVQSLILHLYLEYQPILILISIRRNG